MTHSISNKQRNMGDSKIENDVLKVAPANLTFKNLAFEATMNDRSKKEILAPCCGYMEAGELVAIMGPSGSGKSTMLDMLAMKKTAPYSGEILVNGHPRDPELFRRIASYVGQDDHMPAHWTVREALEFSATLKTPLEIGSRTARRAAQARTEHLLDVFGLLDVATTYIGGTQVRGISGGQRRRVSLARGVAAQASILFADEPTSGLSATDAEVCVRALRTIAKEQNVLMLLNIHQPRREVAAHFDTLILLTPNPGRIVYYGAMTDAPSYMASCGHPVPEYGNATDFYMDLVTPGSENDASSELVQAFEKKQLGELRRRTDELAFQKGATSAEMLTSRPGSASRRGCLQMGPGPFATPFRVQLRALMARKVRITFRNPEAIAVGIGLPAGMGVVLGLLFQGIGMKPFGVATVMFVFILLVMLSLQSLPLMPGLIEERLCMKEETSERLYKESAHIAAGFIVTMPISLISALIQSSIIFGFAGFSSSLFLVIVGWTLLVFTAFDAIFQCMAAVASNGDEALMFATPFLVTFMLFNGVVISRESAPIYLRWLFPISPTYWTLQTIITRIAEEEGQPDHFILTMYNFESGHEFHALWIVVVMNIVFRSLQVLALRYCNKIQK